MSKTYFNYRSLLSAGLVLLAFLFAASAVKGEDLKSVKFEAGTGDDPIELTGRIGNPPTFSRSFAVVANGDKVDLNKPVEMDEFHGDLVSADGTVIDRRFITISPDRHMKIGKPHNLVLTVNNVQVPGVYEGNIWLFRKDLGYPFDKNTPPTIKIKLHAELEPQLKASGTTGNVQMRLVKASPNWFNNLFVPAHEMQPNTSLFFEASPGKVELTESTIEVRPKGSHSSSLTNKDIKVSPATFAANKPIQISVDVNQHEIPAGEYVGSIYLSVKGKSPPVAVPVSLIVRMGPCLAFVLVLIGVLAGRIYKWGTGPGAAQLALLDRHSDAQSSAQVLFGDDASLLGPALSRASKLVYARKTADAETLLTQIETRAGHLVNLLAIANRVRDWQDSDEKKKAEQLIQLGRDAVKEENDQALKTVLEQVKNIYPPPPAAPNGGDQPLAMRLAADQAHSDSTDKPPNKLKLLWSNTNVLLLQFYRKLFRPILSGLSLILIIYAGMYMYYSTVIFGANPAGDMLGALVYGFSADALSRTITSALPRVPTK